MLYAVLQKMIEFNLFFKTLSISGEANLKTKDII